MKVDIVTIFPRMVEALLGDGVVARGVAQGIIDLRVHDLRDFAEDRHRTVDDLSYGGGPGMVLKPAPLFEAVDGIRAERGEPAAVVLLTPGGRRFTQAEAVRLSTLPHMVLLCGRYEGVDDRVRQHLATEEISIGDYVLSGGELAALVVLDAVARLVPGVVGDEASVREDSFARSLLDFPHYTRPALYRGHAVPDVLLSGHHAEIRRWRKREALRLTLERRPELLSALILDAEERELLNELQQEGTKGA